MTHHQADGHATGRRVGSRVPGWVLACTLLLVAALIPVGGAAGPAEPAISARLEPIPGEPVMAYRAFRRLHATSERFNQEAWLEAWTELDGRGFRYQIVSERGSAQTRNRVLHAMLKREKDLVAEGSDRAALVDANYLFIDAPAREDGVRYVLMKPRRKDVVLVDGRLVLTADGGALIRLEGRLARNPSFWTGPVDVTRHFATIDGVRVIVAADSEARVKLAGKSRLEVAYEYESINGRPVSASARQILASATSR